MQLHSRGEMGATLATDTLTQSWRRQSLRSLTKARRSRGKELTWTSPAAVIILGHRAVQAVLPKRRATVVGKTHAVLPAVVAGALESPHGLQVVVHTLGATTGALGATTGRHLMKTERCRSTCHSRGLSTKICAAVEA